MEIEKLEKEIKKIIKFVEDLPERYRDKCFDILVSHIVKDRALKISSEKYKEERKKAIKEISLPIDVRAFMNVYSITEDSIKKLFFIEGEEIRPIYKIETTKKSVAQIQVALFTALENALKNGKFEFSMEDVRNKCKELKCYDKPNFKKHFKNNSKLFKSLDDEEHVELSPEGKEKLAEFLLGVLK